MSETRSNIAGVEVIETSQTAPVASQAPEQTSEVSVAESQKQVRQQIKDSVSSETESVSQNQQDGSDSQKEKSKSKYDSLSEKQKQFVDFELEMKKEEAENLGFEVYLLGKWLWTPKGVVFLKDSEETKVLEGIGFKHHDKKNQCFFRNDLLKCNGSSDSGRKIKTMEEIEVMYSEQIAA